MLNDFTETKVVPIPTEVPDPTSTLTIVPFPSSVVAPTPNLETPTTGKFSYEGGDTDITGFT